jgi:thiol-disulfide isomerase/thioredoxin
MHYPDREGSFIRSLEGAYNIQLDSIQSLFLIFSNKWDDPVWKSVIDVQRIYIPPLHSNIPDQMDGMISHFFDTYDPLNQLILRSPYYTRKLKEYLELIMQRASLEAGKDEEYIMGALDSYLKRLVSNTQVYEASLSYIWDYMHQRAMEKVTEYLDVNYLSGSCIAENDEQLKERLLAYERLAVGSPAPDIIWGDHKKQRSLNEFKGSYTLIVFWASWCPHCAATLSGVHQYALKRENLQVLAIGLDEDVKAWTTATLQYPGWTHVQATEKWDSPIAQDYAVYATPTFYLLDYEGRMLGKAKNLPEIELFLSSEK